MVGVVAKYQQYEEYKDSGVNFLDDIPEHWVVSKVKYLAPFQVGWTPPTKSDLNFIGENLWVNISDLKGKVISNTVKQISDKAALEASMDITPKGSLMYSFKLSVGAVSFAGRDMYTNEAIASFLDTAKLPLSYLYYALPKFVIENASTNIYGAKILNQELIRNAILLELPFDEAEKIAHFLDHETAKIDSLIEKQQQLIQLLKEKRQAVISHAVTKGLNINVPMKDSGVEWLGQVPEHWRIIKLSQVALAFNGDRGSNYPSGNDFVDEGIYFISASEIIDSRILTETASKITQKKYEILGGLKIKKGDIIYCLRGAGVGKNGICDFDEGTVSSSLMGIRSIKLDPEYLVLLLNSSSELQQRSVLVNGSVSPNLSAENVMGYKFAIPSMNEQMEIKKAVHFKIKALENLLAKAESAIQLIQERRTALISAAVTGKIDVRNWQNPNKNNETNMEFSA